MFVAAVSRVVDARGLSHSGAVATVARVVDDLASGTVFEVLTTDAGSVDDIALWCRSTGDRLLSQTSDGSVYHFIVQRRRVWTEGRLGGTNRATADA